VAELNEDRRALPVHGVDHRREAQHLCPRVDTGHAGRGASFGSDTRRTLDDETDAVPRVLLEVAGVDLGGIVTVARAFEHRRAIEAVADRARSDSQWRAQHRTSLASRVGRGAAIPVRAVGISRNALL
jgi:hypothetical protein